MIISRNGTLITTLEQWRDLGGPVHPERQWKPGFSAYEAARTWLEVSSPILPDGIGDLLSTHGSFGDVLEWRATPEVRLPFDEFGGNTRCTDVLVSARDKHGAIVIAVEAKVNESFGATVADAMTMAIEERLRNPRSRACERILGLVSLLFGPRQRHEPKTGELRYQLLTATAGAMAEARRKPNSRVVLLIQEFITVQSQSEARAENARDLNRFVHRLTKGDIQHFESRKLYELSLGQHSSDDPPVTVYLGKVSSHHVDKSDETSARSVGELFYVGEDGEPTDEGLWADFFDYSGSHTEYPGDDTENS